MSALNLQPGIDAGYQALAIVALASHRLEACSPIPCEGHINQALATVEQQIAVMLDLLERVDQLDIASAA
ncbi:hypothetical protein [Mesorhizobium sp. M0767]|uniref:hypothetical protein n=1 Tax=Mesorhizobium sp. M0767 TaxID=2956995 RepID=UPI003337F2B1